MNTDIDWALVFINYPIIRHLNKCEVLAISLTNKQIRAKLNSVIFNDLKINDGLLDRHSNYFDTKRYFKFGNLSFIEKFKLFRKYNFNLELAFKDLYIDPFIKEADNTLNSNSVYCKSLHFSWGFYRDRASYFIFPIFQNFYSLNKLSLHKSIIPYNIFSNLLSKLENLEILEMVWVDLVLSTKENSNSQYHLIFPKSLKELTYKKVDLAVTDWYQLRPRNFIYNRCLGYSHEHLEILPQLLANLKTFVFHSDKYDDLALDKFIYLNPSLKHVSKPNYRKYRHVEDTWRDYY
ncbi:hypothetical protein CONCODRAFT_12870 [Conidiobolus coronatus NRRL 28638]|uniref:F-box domain-containing protein n=1 Tax=Conidiobolus coronatus (strain ATCC 28846 / CBS 209.66 / NRRL 28638) TaxID=796925 RepID=A0A137NRZ4_CONC2|nr:hypothetical protein CONCODRAFT_12870 [Conidiobolus coronatus NRRL 28638]|eukprot:KXN65525.1 hypothetical protein CONCODRAFT_12870 [Conidiobolus coronatus NRRL 28638]